LPAGPGALARRGRGSGRLPCGYCESIMAAVDKGVGSGQHGGADLVDTWVG
jgi:hypothetical protein